MRKFIIAAMFATALPMVAAPADAQRREVRQEQRECQRELRNSDSRREYRRELAECRREIRDARQDNRRDRRRYGNRYDNRYNSNQPYYAEQYYRDGPNYRERRLTRGDRIHRGRDGRYYCDRSDGTTGLIVGGAIGALIGNGIDDGRSSVLGTLIGGAAGAALGREIERGEVRCR